MRSFSASTSASTFFEFDSLLFVCQIYFFSVATKAPSSLEHPWAQGFSLNPCWLEERGVAAPSSLTMFLQCCADVWPPGDSRHSVLTLCMAQKHQLQCANSLSRLTWTRRFGSVP